MCRRRHSCQATISLLCVDTDANSKWLSPLVIALLIHDNHRSGLFVSQQLRRHQHRCKTAKRSLDNYVDTDADVERPFCRSTTASMPTQMQNGERAAQQLRRCQCRCRVPSPLAVALLIHNSHPWPPVASSSATINWNVKIIFFAFCFHVSVCKTDDVRVNGAKCFTFITIGIPM